MAVAGKDSKSGEANPQAAARPMRADARRNHARILQAARLAFTEEGAGVQMEAVARRAEIGVGTLYRHFPTKEALVQELGRHLAEGCARDAEAALEMSDPWESVVWLVERNAEAMARNVGLRDTFALVSLEETCPFEAAALEGGVGALVSRAQDAGVLREDIDAGDFQRLMCGLSAMIKHGGDWRRHAGILLDGLRARGAA